MNVVLVNPPNSHLVNADLAPPLWALILGAIARREGATVRLLDLNLELLDHPERDGDAFYRWATDEILACQPTLVGFSTMCVNSHVSLELARRVKLASARTLTVVGGAHFGVIAHEVVARYPWIDFVGLGEAEHSFGELLRASRRDDHPPREAIEGMVSRHWGTPTTGAFARRPSAQEVPLPAFDLVDLDRYFRINPRRLMDFEAGQRGCRFACRYCYSPGQFGQGERRQEAAAFVEELRRCCSLGAKHFFFVQDNFVNSPQETTALCHEIARARLDLKFHCYATLAQLTPSVVQSLAAAGCCAVYVGVDAVTPEARRDFAKGLYRSQDDMLRRIDDCLAAGIRPTLAFLLEEPAVGRDRLEDTIATALAGCLRGCPIQFNTLTYYPGTALFDDFRGEFRADDLKTRLTMDLPEVVHHNDFAHVAPRLFPFHATHRPESQGSFLLGVNALDTLVKAYSPADRDRQAPVLSALAELASRRHLWDLIERLTDDLDPREQAMRSAPQRRAGLLERFNVLVRSSSTVPTRH